VVNNGATYQAAGTFNQIYNFGSHTGVINIGNFDSANYTFGVTGGGSNFAGSLTTSPPNRTGSVSGSFTGPGLGIARFGTLPVLPPPAPQIFAAAGLWSLNAPLRERHRL
jgi:hypothetical protein